MPIICKCYSVGKLSRDVTNDAQLDIGNGVQLEKINKLCCAAYYFWCICAHM